MSNERNGKEILRRLIVAQSAQQQATRTHGHHLPKVDESCVIDVAHPQLLANNTTHTVWETISRGADQAPTKIYIGPISATSREHYEELVSKNVKAIVNCTTRENSLENHDTIKTQYCQVPINDIVSANILPYLPGATTFIHEQLTVHSVLVHCMAGVSRSVTVVLAYLVRYQNMSLNDAYQHVKQRHPESAPNTGFWVQLKVWERQCRSSSDIAVFPDVPSAAGSSNSNESPPIDQAWARQSVATFTTCRNIEGMDGFADLCFSGTLPSRTSSSLEDVLLVALDCVWGRGASGFAVEWLAQLCNYLEMHKKEWNSSENVSVQEEVLAMLEDPGSEFCQQWEGEMYEMWINRVRKAFSKKNKVHRVALQEYMQLIISRNVIHSLM